MLVYFRNLIINRLSTYVLGVILTFAFGCAGGSLTLPFSKGRQDCNSTYSDDLPKPSDTNTVDTLQNKFSLTVREAVALMGELLRLFSIILCVYIIDIIILLSL